MVSETALCDSIVIDQIHGIVTTLPEIVGKEVLDKGESNIIGSESNPFSQLLSVRFTYFSFVCGLLGMARIKAAYSCGR